jgi:hypothetical protein
VAASGSVAVQVTIAANVVANNTEATINDKVYDDSGRVIDGSASASTVTAGGNVTISATDTSSIDALAFGVAGSGAVSVGVALGANVITNTILAGIDGSTLTAAAAAGVGLSAKSSAVIRTVAVGVSASGTVAVQVTAMGNVIANDVTAVISVSTVTAGKDVTVKAEDVPPSLIPAWIVPADRADELNDNLAGSPVDLDGNILAIMVSVAASGTVAVNASFMGNVITNDVQAIIDHSTVTTTNGGKIDLDADSGAGIIALTVGVAGSGVGAVNATGYGNWIQNTVDASIRNGSNVHSAGLMELTADDDSSVRSLAVSVAGTGAVAVGALIG